MGEPLGPQPSSSAGSQNPSKIWKGPVPWLLLSLPWLGGLFVVLLSTLGPRHDPAYRALEDRLGFWTPRSRAMLSQLYMGHAMSSGLEPAEAMACAQQISGGDDLSLCAPRDGQGAQVSAQLLNDLADFVIQHAPPRDSWPSEGERRPAQESEGGFYFGDSPGDLEQQEQSDASMDRDGRVYDPDAI